MGALRAGPVRVKFKCSNQHEWPQEFPDRAAFYAIDGEIVKCPTCGERWVGANLAGLVEDRNGGSEIQPSCL